MITFYELVYRLKHDYEELSESVIIKDDIIDVIKPITTRLETLLKPKITSILINDEFIFDMYKCNTDNYCKIELVDFKISNIADNYVDCICDNCYLVANMDFGFRIIYDYRYRAIKTIEYPMGE